MKKKAGEGERRESYGQLKVWSCRENRYSQQKSERKITPSAKGVRAWR